MDPGTRERKRERERGQFTTSSRAVSHSKVCGKKILRFWGRKGDERECEILVFGIRVSTALKTKSERASNRQRFSSV